MRASARHSASRHLHRKLPEEVLPLGDEALAQIYLVAWLSFANSNSVSAISGFRLEYPACFDSLVRHDVIDRLGTLNQILDHDLLCVALPGRRAGPKEVRDTFANAS